MGKYNRAPADTFKHIQINAAMLLTAFDTENWTFDRADIIGATTGAVQFNDNTTIKDFGEDINGIKNRTYQLQRVQDRDPSLSATFVAVNMALATKLVAGGVVDGDDATHILPGDLVAGGVVDGDDATHVLPGVLASSSFTDLYMVGDYSDVNTGTGAGGICVIIHNALNTAGFQWSSNKDEKGQFSGEFHGFNDLENDDNPSYEIYIKQGGADLTPSIVLAEHSVEITGTGTHTLALRKRTPADAVVSFTSGSTSVATVASSSGVITGVAAGNTVITASITVNGVTYTDTCTVIVKSSST